MTISRQTAKNRMNKILRETTKGFFNDEWWSPIHKVWKELSAQGFDVIHTGANYCDKNDQGMPTSKVWTFEVLGFGKKPIYGIMTAHAAGSVDDVFSRYDVSAYVG